MEIALSYPHTPKGILVPISSRANSKLRTPAGKFISFPVTGDCLVPTIVFLWDWMKETVMEVSELN